MAIGDSLVAYDAYAVDISAADDGTNGKAIYVGVGGDVKIDTIKGVAVVFTAVAAGSILPVRSLARGRLGIRSLGALSRLFSCA